MSPCSILALVTDGIGGPGGIGQYNRDFVSALARSTAVKQVTVLPRFAAAAARAGKVAHLGPSPRRAAWSVRAVRLAASQKYDVIFCGHIHAAPLAAGLACLTSSRLWLQAHGIEAWERPGAAIRHAMGRADLVTTVSRYTRGKLLEWSNIEPWRVRILPNTVVDVQTPRPWRGDLVARLGLAGHATILTVGRLASSERYKGHEKVIAVLPEIAARIPSVAYLVVGSGDDMERLRGEARRHNVEERVIFAGQAEPNELADYYALADVFCMPSTGEGFGIVFLEAMRSGLPVIGGNRDGSADPLADGALGKLIDPDDRESLIAALMQSLSQTGPRAPQEWERFAFANFSRHVDDLVRSLN